MRRLNIGTRRHQGIDNRPPLASKTAPNPAMEFDCQSRLGGLLRSYHRKAA